MPSCTWRIAEVQLGHAEVELNVGEMLIIDRQQARLLKLKEELLGCSVLLERPLRLAVLQCRVSEPLMRFGQLQLLATRLRKEGDGHLESFPRRLENQLDLLLDGAPLRRRLHRVFELVLFDLFDVTVVVKQLPEGRLFVNRIARRGRRQPCDHSAVCGAVQSKEAADRPADGRATVRTPAIGERRRRRLSGAEGRHSGRSDGRRGGHGQRQGLGASQKC
mmetsp:Transcript_54316/g.125100  ORF Transcript_54316/g.125100 Transcript_54316/m.125100 type:complete len:220 (+) Transcript_54316:655-1314(+)